MSWIIFQPSEGIHPTSPSWAGHPRHRPWGRFSSGWRAAPHNLSVKPQTYPSRLSSWWLAYFASEFYPKSRSCSLNPKSDPLTGTHTSCSVHPMLRVPALSRLHAFRVPAAPGAKGMPGLSGSPLWNRKPTSSCGQWWSRRWPSRSWREGLGASALIQGSCSGSAQSETDMVLGSLRTLAQDVLEPPRDCELHKGEQHKNPGQPPRPVLPKRLQLSSSDSLLLRAPAGRAVILCLQSGKGATG